MVFPLSLQLVSVHSTAWWTEEMNCSWISKARWCRVTGSKSSEAAASALSPSILSIKALKVSIRIAEREVKKPGNKIYHHGINILNFCKPVLPSYSPNTLLVFYNIDIKHSFWKIVIHICWHRYCWVKGEVTPFLVINSSIFIEPD